MIIYRQLTFYEIIGIIITCLGVLGFSLLNIQYWRDVTWQTKLNVFIIAKLIASYSLIDSFGIITSGDVASYISWLFLVKGLMLLIPMVCLKKIKFDAIKENYLAYLVAGSIAGAGYTIAILGFYYTITSYVLSLRAASVIFTIFIARTILKERVSTYKVVLSFVIATGIIIVVGT